jgi:hypothetical protein
VKRALAVILAVGLVVGAVFVRRVLADDSDATDSTNRPTASGPPSVICDDAVAAACEMLAADGIVTIAGLEAGGVTTDRLVAGESLGADTWITASVWPGIVEVLRPEVVPPSSGSIGATRSIMATRPQRAPTLTAACNDQGLWSCTAEAADRPWVELGGDQTWGRVTVGVGSQDSTEGLVTIATATASRLGTADYSRNDVFDDPTVADWFRRFAGAITLPRPGLTPVESLVTVPGSLDVAGGLAIDSTSRADTVSPVPQARVDIVTAGADGIDAGLLADALEATGWLDPGDSALPDTTGLPEPGVMEALRSEWKRNVS